MPATRPKPPRSPTTAASGSCSTSGPRGAGRARPRRPTWSSSRRAHGAPTFTILGINTQDGTGDGLEFAEQYDLNYDSLRDGSGDYADELGSTGVPESILLDPEGNVAYIRRGEVDSELLETEVLPLITGATVEPQDS